MRSSMSKPASLAQSKVAQQPSTDCHNAQMDFLTAFPRKPTSPVEISVLRSIPTLKRAIAYSLHLADMDPKEAYVPLQMDKASWSRIVTGSQEVPATLLKPLRALTGNNAAHMWLAFDDGFELVPLKSELELQLEAERAGRIEAERERDLAIRLLVERAK